MERVEVFYAFPRFCLRRNTGRLFPYSQGGGGSVLSCPDLAPGRIPGCCRHIAPVRVPALARIFREKIFVMGCVVLDKFVEVNGMGIYGYFQYDFVVK